MKNSLLFLVFSIFISYVSAQFHPSNSETIESDTQSAINHDPHYIDSYPDTFFFNNRKLLFRQTPLSLKPGYSGVYVTEENYFNLIFGIDLHKGLRGYRATWIVRNDSLFINRIEIVTDELVWVEPPVLFKDSLFSRMIKFTKGRMINGLLFIDWITGDLGLISKYGGHTTHSGGWLFDPTYYHAGEPRVSIFTDDRRYGFILTVKNGLVVDFKEDRNGNPYGQSNLVQRERETEMVKWIRPYYVDSEPDTLIHDGKRFLFRQSPLSQKQGYTDVFHEDEVSIFNISSNSGILGLKGYHLTWVTRNDSLFISAIYPTYYDPVRPTLFKETIKDRMEAFTGGRFINGLLFVNWISGHFGIITTHTRDFRTVTIQFGDGREQPTTVTYKDDRKNGSLIGVSNGLISWFREEDYRVIKN